MADSRAVELLRDIVAQWEGAEWCDEAVEFLRTHQPDEEWEPSGKCQYSNCDGEKFDWDSTDSRWGAWFCVTCGGMQLPPQALFAAIERGCGQCAHLIKTVEYLQELLRRANPSGKCPDCDNPQALCICTDVRSQGK